jgi:hypothetical protein
MKNLHVLLSLASLTICGICTAVAIYTYLDLPRLPPLVAEPAIIDFGDIQGQDIVRGTSKIKNTTSQPIQILHVIVSCTCGTVTLKPGELLPRQSTELSAAWDLHGRSGNTSETLAIIYVLDGKEQSLAVELRANVVASAETESKS